MSRFLRSKRLRSVLYQSADGKCRDCGCELKEGWHADHVIPWSVSKRTNVHEMQALCPACNLKKGYSMPTVTVDSVLRFSGEFREQRGQSQMWDIAATVDLSERNAFFAHLCTGYGKTLLAYGFFAILRERGFVDCMLALVPGDDQRTQFVDDAMDAEMLIGVSASAMVSEKATREIIGVRDGRIDVLVATYQQLNDGHFNDTFAGKRLLIVADECHHLARTWGANAANLRREATLFLSATPVRSDDRQLIGVPPEPDVHVSYAEAYEEKVVRRVYGEIDHFCLHVTCDGEKQTICTEDLVADGVKDFSAYEAKKRLRYDVSYLDWMLLNPLHELAHRKQMHPGEHQMIVFAMSCKHADYVCGQLRSIAKEVGYDVSVEWVGVGAGNDGQIKSDAENREIVGAFKKGDIDVLVQVDKAGEGFSVKRASVLVFLHLIGFDGKLLQQIGRGIRRNARIDFGDDSCVVFASADTDIARLIIEMEQQVAEVEFSNTNTDSADRQLPLFEIGNLVLVDSEHERTEFVGDALWPDEKAFCEKYGIPQSEYLETIDGRRKRISAADSAKTAREQFDSIKDQVKSATATLCGNVIRVLRKSGANIDRATAGKLKQKINSQWIKHCGLSHDEMLHEDFKSKYEWLQKANEELRQFRKVPSWLS